MKRFAAFLLVSAAIAAASAAFAADYPKMNIRLSHNQPVTARKISARRLLKS